jgi:hypothetical protein
MRRSKGTAPSVSDVGRRKRSFPVCPKNKGAVKCRRSGTGTAKKRRTPRCGVATVRKEMGLSPAMVWAWGSQSSEIA